MQIDDCHTRDDIIERHIMETIRRSKTTQRFATRTNLVLYIRTSNKDNCHASQLTTCGYAHAVFYPSAKVSRIVESRRSVSFDHLKRTLDSLEDNTILITRDFSRLGRFPLSDSKRLFDLYNRQSLRGVKIHVLASQLNGNEHGTPMYDYEMISKPSRIETIIKEQHKSFASYNTANSGNKTESIKLHTNKKIDKRLKSMVTTWNRFIGKEKPSEIKKKIKRNNGLSMSSINKDLSKLKSENLLD
jgi:hypothetical protein